MTSSNYTTLTQLAGKLSSALDNSEELLTSQIASKLRKLSEELPHDSTIVCVASIINKLEDKQPFISKSAIKKLYNQYYTSTTKFAQYFETELGQPTQHLTSKKYANSNSDDSVVETSGANEVIVNALTGVFDKSDIKEYSKEIATAASKRVMEELDNWVLRPNKVAVDAGSENVIIVRAEYETPKGITVIHAPIEVHGKKLIDTGIFICNTGIQELNNINVKAYISKFAGVKPSYNVNEIVNRLSDLIKSNAKPTNAEVAVAKLAAKRSGEQSYFTNSVTGMTVDEQSAPDVQIEKSTEYASIEDRFASAKGSASFVFGDSVVTNGRDMIARQLSTYGYNQVQIKVAKHTDKSISYVVSINGKVGFTVPVKVEGTRVSLPTVMVSNGSVSAFDDISVNALFKSTDRDYKAIATASPMFGLKASDLISNVREAISEGNQSKVEDALNILSKMDDAKAYSTAIELYTESLTGENAKTISKCSCVIRHKHSQNPICGHTNLPLDKVYQDKYGQCKPLYRRSMEETSTEAVSTMNSKIFI